MLFSQNGSQYTITGLFERYAIITHCRFYAIRFYISLFPSYSLPLHDRHMARHLPDIVLCRKLAGISTGKVCANHEGRCILCDSHSNLTLRVRICDECDYGPNKDKCILCSSNAASDAFYCADCVELEEDRDGCPRAINLGTHRAALHFDKQKHNDRAKLK